MNRNIVGKIKSLSLRDFLTYDELQFYPDDYLNIIIGPNGTGKSTVVAAIILGCGGEPALLSRSKDITEYIKNGKTKAQIEIEIVSGMNNEQANFARSFDKNKKETFKVDGRSVNKKEYLRQIKEFNIQVDNLCMFLPQDRVQDFTKMNPQELLHNTQISVCDAPTNEAFNKLIELRSTQKNNASSNANIQTRLSDNRNRNEQLRTLIESNKMKEQLMAKMDILLKKKAWCEYDKVKEQVIVIEADLKLLNDKIKKKNNDLNPLRDKQQQLAGTKTAIKNAISKAGTSINAVFAEMDRFTDAADKCESDVNSEKQRIRNVISSVEDHAKQVEEMQLKINLERNELQKAKDALEADDSIRDRSTECDQKIEQIKSANEKLLRQRNTITKALDDTIVPSIRVCERKLANLNDTQRQRVDVLRNQFEDVYRAYEWLKLNRHRFRGKIFDPIMVEITVKQKENAKYIENVIAIKDLQAFVCTDKGDMSQLIKILRNDMNLQVNIAYSEDTDEVTFAATRDITDYPPSLGLYSYLIDMFHAPAPIVNYLCRISGIHQVGVGDDRTFQNASSVPNEFKVFFSTEHRFAVTISRYSNSKSVSSSIISDRNWLNVGTDNRLKEREEKNLAKWNKDSKEKKDSRAKIEVEIKKNEEKLAIVRNQKNEIQKRLQFVKLATDKLSKKAAELEALKNRKVDVEEESQKSKANIRKLLKTLLSVNKKRVEKLVEYRAHRLERMFAQQKLQVFEDSTGNVDEEIRLIQNEINTTSNLVNRVKERFNETNHRLKAIEKEALKLTDGIAPSHAKFKYRAKFDELPHSVDELQNEMDNMQGRIDCIRGVDPQIVAEYEERKKEIEELEKILVDEIARMQSLEKKIETLHARWLPVVETVVHTINDNFSEFFKKMGFVGEVELIRKEERDYADYGIQIRVQYRDNEKLQALNRHVQSGGERAVAIAVYTLSLQHLTSVPFRCVDEINQGMDPKNERKIFQMLVDITCQEGQSQYFFVTPKLLPDLPFSPLMSVHVVHNGNHIEDSFVFLDVEEEYVEMEED